MKNKPRLAYILLNTLTLWFALILQFYISTKQYHSQGNSITGAIIQILSYFTIQTNLIIALLLTIVLFRPGWGRFFSRISVLTAMAVYITIVGLIYNVILKGIWEPQGWFKVADFMLHTLSPIMFVVFWLFFVPGGIIKWKQVLLWALFPLLYLAYSLLRGIVTGYYPYPFIDVVALGYGQVAVNSVLVLLSFLVISACFMAINRFMKKGKATHL